MNKKIFILLFCLIMLISVSAVSAADLDDNNETVVASDMEVEKLSASNDVNAMDELNEDDTGSDDVLQSDAKSAAAGEKEILSVGDSDSDVLGAKGSTITIEEAYSQKIGSDYKIIVTGYVKDVDDQGINKGTVSIYLNDESKRTCNAKFGWFSGEVDVGPGNYNVRVRYHDDSGDYLDSQNDYSDNPIIIKPPEPVTWYVNGSKTFGKDGKSEENAFSTLNEALVAANNNDTVKIAAGTYAGSANIGGYIQKILTFEKYGDGEAIFDGQGQGTIWSVSVNTINIYGLTFINGGGDNGGALYFSSDLSNSVINATFRDNSVKIYGAAVYIKNAASNLILNSTFIGNTAGNNGAGVYIGDNADNVKVYGEYRNNAASQGGVIYANKAFSSSVIDATFINNTAKKLGGAFCFNGDLTGVDISGKFLNNTGGDSIIYVANSVSGNSIHDSVFLNNEAYKICTVYNGEITAKDNWFGSDASNYYKIPEDVGIDLENWLFLNATADPSELAADEKSTIIFKLSSFDGSGISDYDASKMNVVLELSQTLGQLNKNTTLIGQEVIYTAKQEGNASVTGKVGTAYYTINLKNSEYRPAAVLNIYMISPGEYNPSFTVDIGGTVKNIMTGDKIKKGSVKLYLNGENVENVTVDVDDGSIFASLGVLNAGNYTVKAVYHDDTGEFKDCEWNSSLEIKQAPTEIKLVSDTGEMSVGAIAHVAAELSPSEAGNLSYASNDTSIVDVSSTGVIVANGAGTALITVSFAGDDNYAEAENKTITLTVNLNPASVSVNNSTLELYVDDNFTIVATTSPAGLNVTFVQDDSGVYTVDSNGVVIALKEGTGNVLVKVGGDGVYAENSTEIAVTVSKIPTDISVAAGSLDLKVLENFTAGASLTPADAGNLTYTSSNKTVVIVEDGMIMALGEGTATVTVSFAGDYMYAAAENKTIDVAVSLNPASVSVNNSTLELFVDDNFTIVAIPVPAGLNVTFVQDDSGVYNVDSNGVVTALKEGTGNVLVKVGDGKVYAENSTEIAVTVSKIPTDISVAAGALDLKVLENFTAGASLTPADAGNLTYTSSNKTVVIVEDGMIMALGEGTATVTVSFAGDYMYAAAENKTIDVSVSLNPASVSVNNSTLELFVDDNFTIVATPVPAGLNVTFVQDDSGVYTVDENGLVTALKEGTGNILVKVGDGKVYAENSTEIHVTVSKIPTEVIVQNATIEMKVTDEVSPVVSIMPSDAGELDFTSSDVSVVTVNGIGTITAVGEGVANVTVRFMGNDKYSAAESKNITVTVSKIATEIVALPVTTVYNVGENLVITLKDENGNPLNNTEITVNLNGVGTFITDENGQVNISTRPLLPDLYVAEITFKGNDVYDKSAKSVKVKIQKAATKITMKSRTYKVTTKVKRYTIAIKNNKGIPLYNKKVYIIVRGVTYSAITDSQGFATFKITNLNKKGTFKATAYYKGNNINKRTTNQAQLVVK